MYKLICCIRHSIHIDPKYEKTSAFGEVVTALPGGNPAPVTGTRLQYGACDLDSVRIGMENVTVLNLKLRLKNRYLHLQNKYA
jgi:hypothetical protein